MARVLLENVIKKFGNQTVVHKTNLEIKDKEFLVLVGPSGCGKSTTLRMIAGLEEITGGRIYIDGRVVNEVPPKDRDIAMVFQNYALYPHMNIYDNLAFALKLRKLPKERIDERVKAAARMLELEELLNRKPSQISGGQRQRVALGRAVVREPKVFLMDEPLSNLDAKLRVQMRTELKQLHEKVQTTIIYVTHDQTEAMTMGDRLVVMKKGVVQQVDSPINMYNNPENLFVASFIGSPAMNFIRCKLTRNNGVYMLINDCFKLAIPKDKTTEALKNYIDREVIMGIRPENISDKPLPDMIGTELEDSAITSKIDVVEPLGSETFVHTRVSGSSVTAKVSADSAATSGLNMKFYYDMTKVHIFESETEKNISLI